MEWAFFCPSADSHAAHRCIQVVGEIVSLALDLAALRDQADGTWFTTGWELTV